MSDRITIECPKCGKKVRAPRQSYDYPEAVRMTNTCPDCWDGDFDDVTYFDSMGKVVEYDPAEIPRRAHQGKGKR